MEALQDRCAMLREKGDTMRECKAMHEENLLSSWLREDGEREDRKRNGSG